MIDLVYNHVYLASFSVSLVVGHGLSKIIRVAKHVFSVGLNDVGKGHLLTTLCNDLDVIDHNTVGVGVGSFLDLHDRLQASSVVAHVEGRG